MAKSTPEEKLFEAIRNYVRAETDRAIFLLKTGRENFDVAIEEMIADNYQLDLLDLSTEERRDDTLKDLKEHLAKIKMVNS